MTQLLIDRATLEQLLVALEEVSDYINRYSIPAHQLELDPIDESIKTLNAALANAEPTCTWSKDPDFEMGDTYDSSCGEKWSFIDGGPTENRVRFCQGCGKPVKLTKEQP